MAASFVVLVGSLAEGASRSAGTTTANFLKIGIQSRAVGLGEAVTSLADGVSFAGYNPASVRLTGLTLGATHTALYEGVNLEEVAIGIPFGKRLGMVIRGGGIQFDKTERTDEAGNKTGTFGASSFAVGAGFYFQTERVSFGIFGKTIQQKIDAFKASTAAADIGFRYQTPLPGISLGAAVLNVGRPVKFIQQEDELPMAARAGISYDAGYLKLSVDGVRYNDQPVFLSAGAEVSLFGALRFRAGYSDDSELSSPLRGGIGFRFSSVELDYAYTPGQEFGASHRVTLTVR
ncbi:PorV/PorQ family protein [bacterium]|nr:PorV/PorQ family protein [bacterium]